MGLYDMLRKVWGCAGTSRPRLGPAPVTDPLGPASGECRVTKSGRDVSGAAELKPTRRIEGGPVGRKRERWFPAGPHGALS